MILNIINGAHADGGFYINPSPDESDDWAYDDEEVSPMVIV